MQRAPLKYILFQRLATCNYLTNQKRNCQKKKMVLKYIYLLHMYVLQMMRFLSTYTFQFLVYFQIKLSIMGNGNNQITNDMEEVAKELTISSLRGSQVNINLDDFEGDSLKSHPFPVFHRKSFIGSNNVRESIKSTNLLFALQ